MKKLFAAILSLAVLLTPISVSAEEYEKMTDLKKGIHVLFNRSETASVYHNGEVSTDYFDESAEFTPDEAVMLIKEDGRDFKILTLDDIHFSDYGYRAFFSIFNVMRIKRLVSAVKPDLIILPGDIVCGEKNNSTYYSIQRITDLMESFGIPWAPVFGNHDDEANCDLNFLADIMMKSPHCLLKKGDPRMGVGNYIINIAKPDGSIIESIFMMDSHHSQPNELQQKWYKRGAEGIKRLADGKAEFSLFMHIPLPEYRFAYEEAWDAENKEWREGFNACGVSYEEVCCESDSEGVPVQRGFFDIIKESGAEYVFCAHDHVNDFSIEYHGVRLTYLMKLGRSSGCRPLLDGGSVITVGDDGINSINHKIQICGVIINFVNIQIENN